MDNQNKGQDQGNVDQDQQKKPTQGSTPDQQNRQNQGQNEGQNQGDDKQKRSA